MQAYYFYFISAWLCKHKKWKQMQRRLRFKYFSQFFFFSRLVSVCLSCCFSYRISVFLVVFLVASVCLFVCAVVVKTMLPKSRDEREPALHSGAFGDHKSANSEKKKIEKNEKNGGKLFFFKETIWTTIQFSKNNEDVLWQSFFKTISN